MLSVIILTFNEEIHIARAITSALPIANEIFIVDSYSTDRTVEIARSLGASVIQHEFLNYAQQFQWAIDNCPIHTDWVMRLDADEYLTSELVDECKQRLASVPPDITGIDLKRRQIFMGRWIRHGDRYPLVLLRIWRRGKARIEQRWMDEHMVLTEGRAVTLQAEFCDDNLRDIGWWTDKHNRYATREALDVIVGRHRLGVADDGVLGSNQLTQPKQRRILKERVYNNLPFFIAPLAYFIYRYVIRLGFLDGREGLVYHLLQGFWYRFLVQVRLLELEGAISRVRDRQSKLEILQRTTRCLLLGDSGNPGGEAPEQGKVAHWGR